MEREGVEVPATISIDADQIQRLKNMLKGSKPKFAQQLSIAINETQKKITVKASRAITEELAVKASVVKQKIKGKRATKSDLSAKVTVKASNRLSLREFGAKQNKRGVTYKISKTKGRKLIAGAFQGPKPGVVKISWRGNVFKREGKPRLPIVKRSGPSPWGVYVKSGKDPGIRKEARQILREQIERRIKFLKLKESGEIK